MIKKKIYYKSKKVNRIIFSYFVDKKEEGTANVEEYSDMLLITNLYVSVSERNRGIGTKIVNTILKDADDKCMITSVYPASYGSVDYQNKLIEYYQRFGFELVDTKSFEMKRFPKGKCKKP